MSDKIWIAGIAFIVGIFVGQFFSSLIVINWKEYRKAWEPIYKHRKEQFDVYLKEALENSKRTESNYSVARLAAELRLKDEYEELNSPHECEQYESHYDSNLEKYIYEYEHELRSAGIE